MRCYLMKKGHIAAVEFLNEGSDDQLVEQARSHFERHARDGIIDGFEVWDRARRVYFWPEETIDKPSS